MSVGFIIKETNKVTSAHAKTLLLHSSVNLQLGFKEVSDVFPLSFIFLHTLSVFLEATLKDNIYLKS